MTLQQLFEIFKQLAMFLWDPTTKYFESIEHNLIAPRMPPKLKVLIGILPVLGPN